MEMEDEKKYVSTLMSVNTVCLVVGGFLLLLSYLFS